jgi:hypothetical protein
MAIYKVDVVERIYEVAYIEADSVEEAKAIASEDWNVNWDIVDAENFYILEILPVPEKYVDTIEEKKIYKKGKVA